jgi:hypothetical protein
MTDRTLPIGYPDALVVVPGQENLMFMAGARGSPRTWREARRAEAHIGRSHDGGATWELLSEGLPIPLDGNVEAMSLMSWPGGFELFAGTTAGDIYCSDDEGEHWVKIVAGWPAISKTGHFRILQPA